MPHLGARKLLDPKNEFHTFHVLTKMDPKKRPQKHEKACFEDTSL
jgi:hypothetical protein